GTGQGGTRTNGESRARTSGESRTRSATPASGGRQPRAATNADADADDVAPRDSTPDTQREDALPDGAQAPSTGGARKRRGRRGSGATKRAASAQGSDRPIESTTDTAAPRRTRAKTTEEQVEAGGPTRGLRSSRSRTGRVGGGRRRREDTVVVPRITDKVMVITEHGDRDQIAVLEEDVLVQHYVTRTGARSMVGNVYLGRVQNVLP